MTLSNLSNAANYKCLLARIWPKEMVTVSIVHSGNIKKVDYAKYVSSILNGSKKTSLASVTTEGDWYYDRSAEILYYYTVSASKNIFVTFGIFVTTGQTSIFNVDPLDANTDLVVYEGRLIETSFAQNIDDISNGVLGISATSIEILNQDAYFNSLINNNISFKSSSIDIILYFNDLSNSSKIFVGIVESAKFFDSLVLEVKDSLKKLQSPPYYSEYAGDYLLTSTSQFGDSTPINVPDENYGKIIPLLLGEDSSYKMDFGKTPVQFQNFLIGGGNYEFRYTRELNTRNISEDDSLKTTYIGDSVAVLNLAGKITKLNFDGSPRYEELCPEYCYSICRTINGIKSTYTPLTITSSSMVEDLDSVNYIGSPYFLYFSRIKIKLSGSGRLASEFFEGQLCSMITTNGFDGWAFGTQFPSVSTIATSYGQSLGLLKIETIDTVENSFTVIKYFCQAISKEVANETKIFFSPISCGYVFNSDDFLHFNPIAIKSNETTSTGNSFKKLLLRLNSWNDGRDSSGLEYNPYTVADCGNTYKKYIGNINDVISLAAGYTEGYSPDVPLNVEPAQGNVYNNQGLSTDEEFIIKFKQQNTGLSLGNILHKTIISAGLQSDSGSTLATITSGSYYDLDQKLGTTYFALKSTDADSYLGLLEKMLSSVFGFLYLNDEGKIGVRLFEKTPYNSTLHYLSENDIIKNSVVSEFTDNNISTILNIQTDVSYRKPKYTYSEVDKITLNGSINLELDNFITSETIVKNKVIPRKYAYYSNSVIRFKFTLINTGYDILLGDRISINFNMSKKWIGDDKTYELFVTGIDKSLNGVEITAIENIFPTL